MAGGSLRKKAKRSATMASRSVPFRHRRFCLAASFTILVVLLCVVVLLSVSSETLFRLPQSPRIYTIEVVNEYPHDPKAFTQGLLYGGNDTLFESTGLHGQSSVRKVAQDWEGTAFSDEGFPDLDEHIGFLTWMNILVSVETIQRMNNTYFGEGLTLLGERLYQVTWLTQTGFIYERNSLSKIERFTHQMTDGWGLATDGRVMFGSDGTSTLYQIDPQTMKVTKTQTVKHEGIEVPNLNELEFVNGEVWANIWQTDCIARISPIDGTILGWILLPNLREGLWLSGKRDIDVLNGIAWDGDEHRLFVTGKLWPKLYEIKVHPAGENFHGDIKQLCIRMPFRP